jgi:hypothetical protein
VDALVADSHNSQIGSPALLAVLWHNNLLVDRFTVTLAIDRSAVAMTKV